MTTETTANGVYSDCGYGLPVGLTVTCAGPSCASLNSDFPYLTCTAGGPTTNCSNGITCPGPVNFQSIFSLLQQGLTVTTNQNLSIAGQPYKGSDPGTGASVTISAIGQPPATSVAGCPATTAARASGSSSPVLFTSGSRRLSYPNMMFVIVMILSLFITQIAAQSPSAVISGIVGLFPPGNDALLEQVAQTFCGTYVYPVVDNIVSGQETRERGVADLVQYCLDVIDSTEIGDNSANGNPSTAFGLALGNLLVCDKIANTILEKGGSELCVFILEPAPSPGSTTTVTSTATPPARTITAAFITTVTSFETIPRTVTTTVPEPTTILTTIVETRVSTVEEPTTFTFRTTLYNLTIETTTVTSIRPTTVFITLPRETETITVERTLVETDIRTSVIEEPPVTRTVYVTEDETITVVRPEITTVTIERFVTITLCDSSGE